MIAYGNMDYNRTREKHFGIKHCDQVSLVVIKITGLRDQTQSEMV